MTNAAAKNCQRDQRLKIHNACGWKNLEESEGEKGGTWSGMQCYVGPR